MRKAITAGLLCLAAGFSSGPADAQGDSYCPFLRKLVPSVKSEFTEWKGEEDTSLSKTDHTMFKTILTPGANIGCTLYVRRLVAKEEAPPLYSCILAEDKTYDDIVPIYTDAAAQLKNCYPDWKFVEKKSGDVAKRSEHQSLTATPAGLEVKLQFSDIGALADAFNGTPSGKPGVMLTLDVESTLAAAPNHAPLPRMNSQ